MENINIKNTLKNSNVKIIDGSEYMDLNLILIIMLSKLNLYVRGFLL